MINKTLKEIEVMAEGYGLLNTFTDITIHGVSIDSRTVKPGNLFIPIIREKDGHSYVEEAISKGAVASLWQRDHLNPPEHLPLVYIDNCTTSLHKIAAMYRQQLKTKVVGITGSNGKTTTKDILTSVLETEYKVHKTKGNLNSQIGVPLTILEIEELAEVAVIEMGMSERYQIEKLSEIVKPDISIITMIGVSHLSSLGSREEIAAAKMEIVYGMSNNGVLIYNGDEPLLNNLIEDLKSKTLEIVSFGENHLNDYFAHSMKTDINGSMFLMGSEIYSIPLMGRHNIFNAIPAIIVAEKMGITPDHIRKGLQKINTSGMRMEKKKASSGLTIINDAWNASPVSMIAAIRAFEEFEGFSRKFLVLGDMLELGDGEVEFHIEIGNNVDSSRIDYLFTIGDLGKYIANAAIHTFPVERVKHFSNKEELISQLIIMIEADDVVLVKASRGMEMESVVNSLMKYTD